MKLRILHLEDNADDVELVRRSLARQGLDCNVHAVSTGSDYLSALEAQKFDLILSDSGLPGYDGQAALAAAHERCPGVPFIVVSGSVAPSPLDKVSPRGAAAHVSKNEIRQLGGVIQFALQNTPQPSPVQTQGSQPYVLGMKHLVAVVQRLSLARNLETIMAIVRRAARDLTGADGATFVLREGERCYYADEDAIAPLWKGQRFPLSACVSGWTMLNREPAVIEDIYADSRVPHDAYRPTFVKSLVMMPIRTVAPVGAIGVYWARQHRATAEEVELLSALADSTSIAIEAADLFHNLEQRVAERTIELHRRSAELEVVNRELESFSYSVAHDLRSPLIAIDGFRQALLEESESPTDDRREFLGRIGTAVTRMHRVIEDLLSLSKISQTPMQRVNVNLASIAREITWSLRERDPQRLLEFVIPDSLLVQGDAGLLRTALENLMSNAWKFTARRKSAQIEIGLTNPTNAEVAIYVRDNGAGFDPRYAQKLFIPFHRLHTQAEFPGTGIGLAIVQRVIQRHGGKIWAEGAVDRGATFYFTIPALLSPS